MNTEMKIFETEIKDIQELQAKARKYDELKEAVGKIKEEIQRKANSGQWSEATIYGMNKSISIIDKHLKEVENG